MSTFKAVILKGNVHQKSDGTTNVKIRITHNRKADYISTDLYIEPNRFDIKSGTVKNGPNKGYINLRITEYIQKYLKKDIEFGERRDFLSVKELKTYLLDKKDNSDDIDFFEFAEGYLETIDSEGTMRWHESTLSNLKSFIGSKLPFSEINLPFLQRFERFLKMQGVKGGINNYMRSFRAIFNKARDTHNDEDSGVIKIPHYPFRKYKIPKTAPKSKKHILTVDELKMFINYKHSTPGEKLAKDMFLLMFYLIGIEIKDLFYLQKARKGRVYFDRFKTSKEFSIKLEPEALAIVEKYASKTSFINAHERYSEHRNFMKYINIQLHGSNSKTKRVKGIFPTLGIDKPVTTKWARHTWATIARNNCRIDKDDVALCLGHEDSDNRVTDIYVDYDYTIIDDSNRKVIDFVNSHSTSLDVTLDNK
jgi:integrase